MIRISNWLVAVTGLALLAAAIVLAHGRMTVTPRPPQLAPERSVLRYEPGSGQLSAIRVQAVQLFPVPLAEPLNGRVTFNENVTARVTSPISGRVVSLAAQVGDAVKAGDTLAVLDSPDLAAAVADLRKARADEARKQPALERARSLYEAGVFARKDLEAAEADDRQARAETERAAMRLRNLAPNGGEDGQYALRAPIAGVVADRQLNPGMEVRPDLPNPLFIITSPARLWVVIDLPERDLSKVGPGQPVAVQVDAWPDDRFPARIDKIGEVVDPATRRVQVRCSLVNPERKLKPEMYARVTLLSDENRTAVRLPNTALVTEGLYSYVFVEQSPGAFRRRRVQLAVQDRDYSYVQSGVEPGERIVVAGSVLLNSELGATAQ
ncbi:MAG TPA: efflux RND transporter periplasmic adaptor subunit [Burkholderiales bacterium]|nr:efflux RND transporter periplasmic adaptor subunit [Burkholderiales bacterium]